MYKKRTRKKRKNNYLVFVVIVFCLILSSIFIKTNISFSKGIIRDGLLFIDNIFKLPFSDNKINNEVNELRKDNEQLSLYKLENIELKKEIEELKEVLNINNMLSDKSLINSSVINRDLDYWFDSLTIDKGLNSGVFNNMAVVNNGVLIGITNNVSNFNSDVFLLSNNKFPISISVKIIFDDYELFGILNRYQDGFYEITGISDNVDIKEGSLVVTSGLGNIFPSGLEIGHVHFITRDNFDLSKTVYVKPSFDFNNIKYVTVVKRDF